MSSQFRLSSRQHAKAIYPRTEDDKKVVESSQTHSAVPPAAIQVEATDDHNRFEECDDDSPVKMLKQKAEENITLHVSPERINSCQSERPIGKLQENEENQIEPIPAELVHLAFLSQNVLVKNPVATVPSCSWNRGTVRCFSSAPWSLDILAVSGGD